MVGGRPPSEPEVNSHALMSLLREGGQWNGEDDIVLDTRGPRAGRLSPVCGMRSLKKRAKEPLASRIRKVSDR